MGRNNKIEQKKFYCTCGGNTKTFIVSNKNGKTKNVARCLNCGIEKSKLSCFTGVKSDLKCT